MLTEITNGELVCSSVVECQSAHNSVMGSSPRTKLYVECLLNRSDLWAIGRAKEKKVKNIED